MTLKQLLSNYITKKIKHFSKDYNKEKINLIFEKNERFLMDILNMTLREILNIYCDNNVKNNIFKYFKRLKDDIEKYQRKNESVKYIELYEETATNFEKIINTIIPRNR